MLPRGPGSRTRRSVCSRSRSGRRPGSGSAAGRRGRPRARAAARRCRSRRRPRGSSSASCASTRRPGGGPGLGSEEAIAVGGQGDEAPARLGSAGEREGPRLQGEEPRGHQRQEQLRGDQVGAEAGPGRRRVAAGGRSGAARGRQRGRDWRGAPSRPGRPCARAAGGRAAGRARHGPRQTAGHGSRTAPAHWHRTRGPPGTTAARPGPPGRTSAAKVTKRPPAKRYTWAGARAWLACATTVQRSDEREEKDGGAAHAQWAAAAGAGAAIRTVTSVKLGQPRVELHDGRS